MHIVDSKPKIEIPQELLDELRRTFQAQKSNCVASPEYYEFRRVAKKIAALYGYGFGRNGDRQWNRFLDQLDDDYPLWRGYPVHVNRGAIAS